MQEMNRIHGGDGAGGGVFGNPQPPPPLPPQAYPAAAETAEALSAEEQVSHRFPLSLSGTTPSVSGEVDIPNFVDQSHLALPTVAAAAAPPQPVSVSLPPAQATAAIGNIAMVTAETPVGPTERTHTMPGIGHGQALLLLQQQQGYQPGYQQGHQCQDYSAGPSQEMDGAVHAAPPPLPVYVPHTATGGQTAPPLGLEPQFASATAAAAPSFGHGDSSSNGDGRIVQREQQQQQQPAMVPTELNSRLAPGPAGVCNEVAKPSPLLWQGDAAGAHPPSPPPQLPPPQPPFPSPPAARVPPPPPSPSGLPPASPAMTMPPQDEGYRAEAGHEPPHIKVRTYL